MKNEKALTLIEVVVTIVIIIVLFAVLIPRIRPVKNIEYRVYCGTN